jgi:hypothetical protein
VFIELQVFLKLSEIGFLFGVSTIGIFKQLFQGFLNLKQEAFPSPVCPKYHALQFLPQVFLISSYFPFPILFLLLFLFSHSSFFLVFLLVFVGFIMAMSCDRI